MPQPRAIRPRTRRRGFWAWWLPVGMLPAWVLGCACFHTDPAPGGLQQRILPPPEILPVSTAPEPSAAPAPVSQPDEAGTVAVLCGDSAVPLTPLTLEQAVELALQHSPQLEAMHERIARAEGGEQIAFADFLPDARFSFRHLQSENSSDTFVLPTIPTYVGNVAYGTAADRFERSELSVQGILWDFGRTSGKYGQAVSAVEIARLQYFRARQTVTFQVAAAYFAVLQAQASRRVAEEAVRRAESDLRDARNFLKRGTAIRNDVYRAEVFLAEMQLGQVRARTAEAGAIAQLNQVMGVNVSSSTRVVDVTGEPVFHRNLAECLQLAADHRDEFRVVLETVRSARLGKDVAKAEFLPRILVGGTGSHQDGPTVSQPNLLVGGLNLELTLFEGGRRVGRVRAAQAEVREAIARGKEICDRIAYEVNIAYLGIEDARQRIELSRTMVTQAEENRRRVRSLFARGDATPTDVVDAELTLIRAQQNRDSARYDYQTALARLVYAVGTPLPGTLTMGNDHPHD